MNDADRVVAWLEGTGPVPVVAGATLAVQLVILLAVWGFRIARRVA